MWIEIFRTGMHKDSSGRKVEYDSAALDRITRLYNDRVTESASYQAPLVKGHPKDNDPAFGWVKRLKRNGDKIVADIHNISEDLIEEVKKGMFKKVSIALYPDLLLRHIGLLGAFPPAVKGLKPVTFADTTELTEFNTDFEFNERESNLFDLEIENEELRTSLNTANEMKDEAEKKYRTRDFREFCNSLLESDKGAVILPAQTKPLMDLLEMAFHADNAEYREEGILNSIMDFVSNLSPQFSIDSTRESTKNTIHNFNEYTDFSDKMVSEERLLLHEKAIELLTSEPTLSYEEAVKQVY